MIIKSLCLLLSILSLVLALLSSKAASADMHLPIHPLYLEQFEPTDYYFSMLRSHNGYLWIGSDVGLVRYNGATFKHFTFNPDDPSTIGSLESFHLLQTRDHKLWVGGNLLSQYHPETETFTRYNIANYSPIFAMYEDENGHLWVAGLQTGIIQFDPIKGQVVNRFYDKPGEVLSVFAMTPSQHFDGLWLATNKGLALFELSTQKLNHHFQVKDHHEQLSINGIAEDAAGKVWVSTYQEGLYAFDPVTEITQHFDEKDGLNTQSLTSMMMDSSGDLWIGTEKSGIYHYDSDRQKFSFSRPSDNDPLHIPVAAINNFHEDYEGNIWISAGKKGIYRASPKLEKFDNLQHSFDSDNSLIHNNLAAIYEAKNHIIWLGTNGGGLSRYDRDQRSFTHYLHQPDNPNSLGTNTVLDIAEDDNGYLWLGTWGGRA